MSSKQQLQYLKSARAAFIRFFKKKKTGANSFLSLVELKIDNNTLSTRDSNDTKGEFGTLFLNVKWLT